MRSPWSSTPTPGRVERTYYWAHHMYLAITNVYPNDDFTLSVAFEDGSEGILDMKPYLDFGSFAQLRQRDQFNRVRVGFDTIEWECGLDLDPEFVRARAEVLKLV
jgi:hypothetical protein